MDVIKTFVKLNYVQNYIINDIIPSLLIIFDYGDVIS